MIKGYMLFAADTPLIGLDPHPAYAPEEASESYGASVWARLYHVKADRAELEREALEDLEAARDAVEEGGLEDCSEEPDEVFPVIVSDAGVLTVMDPEGAYVMAEYAPADVYGAFGMTPPTVLPDQRAEAWGLIREQLDGLAGLLRANGVDRAETEYLQEDGVAGLQDVRFFGYDDVPVEWPQDQEGAEYPLPPLVSRTENGRAALIPLNGTGSLRDVADAVFGSLSEFVLDDPNATVDRVRIRLNADGTYLVETDATRTTTWLPPAVEDALNADRLPSDDDTPGL
jgi:hypothetical protein